MAWRVYNNRQNKLGNKKVITPDGEFDSKREYNRFCELHILLRRGLIKELDRQVPFPLIPAQRAKTGEVYKRGPRKGQPKEGALLEHAVTYVADFVYIDTATGEKIVEDAKGYRNTSSATYKVFVLKRKMMLWLYGIQVKEV